MATELTAGGVLVNTRGVSQEIVINRKRRRHGTVLLNVTLDLSDSAERVAASGVALVAGVVGAVRRIAAGLYAFRGIVLRRRALRVRTASGVVVARLKLVCVVKCVVPWESYISSCVFWCIYIITTVYFCLHGRHELPSLMLR
jgi:hypothetical protein